MRVKDIRKEAREARFYGRKRTYFYTGAKVVIVKEED